MDWKTASATYSQQLKDALDVQRHALHLLNLPQTASAGITLEQKNRLLMAGEQAEKLVRRLENAEFRIAVVGLEKAGKSTFVNAWLGSDLLPAKTERCTFTTTQIYSVQHESNQRLEVEPKPVQGQGSFADYKAELMEQQASADLSARETATKDLKVIEDHQQTLNEVLREGRKTIPFSRLEEIKPYLDKYVADERYAHAMHEARLYTRELAAIDGVVFFDVPGLNSGLSKHIKETRNILSDCDAIVVIQSRTVSLQAHEQDMVKFGEGGDPYLKLADKLFVFWGQIDLHPSRATLDEDWAKLLAEWNRFGIPEKRIVRGSAGAHLVLHHYPIPKVGDIDEVQRKMRLLTGFTDDESLKSATGIPELKSMIQQYLDTERSVLLGRRCEQMLQDILQPSHEIYRTLKVRYPEDPELAKRSQEDCRRIEFAKWWKGRWDKMEAEVANHCKTRLQAFLETEVFQKRYEELVVTEMDALPSRQPQKRQEIFDKESVPVFDSNRINDIWRREYLYPEVRQLLKNLSHNLAMELQNETEQLMSEFKRQLWNSNRVESEMIHDKVAYTLALERSLNTLFLRFARPVAELLISSPVGGQTREYIRNRIGADIEIIDNYYSGEEPALKRLGRFANHGIKLLQDEDLRKKVLGPATGVTKFILKQNMLANIAIGAAEHALDSMADKAFSTANTKAAVIEEVEADIQALEHYLLKGIFEAAGFSVFCEQELDNLRDSFREKEATWGAVAQNEWYAGNSELLKELPSDLRTQQFDTEVSDRLRQLGIALQKVRQLNEYYVFK